MGRDLGIVSAVSALFVLFAGAAMVVPPWLAFERFHSEDLVPLVVGLDVTRARGAWGAAMVACLHLTALQHHGVLSRVTRPEHARWSRTRIALVAACSVPVFYIPVSLLALAGAMIVARGALGLSPRTFFHAVNADDVAGGVLTATVLGLVPFGWVFVSQALFASSRRSLRAKLFLTWLCMIGVSFGLNLAASLVSSS